MGGGTLAVNAWAANEFNDTVSRTMGMVVFSLSNVAFSLATKDERLSAFSIDLLGDRPFFLGTHASIVTIILMAELDFFNRFLETTGLTLDQWAICIVVGLLIIPVSEVRKRIWDVEEEDALVEPSTAVTAA
jgi:Ca2+-transporting ATPase